jgi:peptidoglycan/xylan/chitin deacetylase (PgdA/CDA1 family)
MSAMTVRDPHGRPEETVVSLTFDDGWANQYATRPLFAAYELSATFYVNSSTIGAENFLTWRQLAELEADGHEIGGHGLDHLDLVQLSPDGVRVQVSEDRTSLLEHGIAATSFAYPFGAHDAISESIVRECGYTSARAAWGLRNISARRDKRPSAGSLPPSDPYAILTPCCIDSGTDLSALREYIVRAEDEGGGWVPLVLHRVCEGCSDSPAASISTATLEGLLHWLRARTAQGTVVRTVAQVMNGASTPTGSATGHEATPLRARAAERPDESKSRP